VADIFLSYSREDHVRAEQIAKALTAAGYEVFWDVEIPPGKSWADVLEEKLGICKAAIVLWSRISTASKWVREEARLAHDRGKLIPVQIDDAPPPFGFGEIQAADLKQWRGDTSDPHWRSLLSAVSSAVARPPLAQPMTTTAAARAATLTTISAPLRAMSAPIASIASRFPLAARGYVLAGVGILALAAAIALRYMPTSTDHGSIEELGASPVTDDGTGGNSGASGSTAGTTTSDEGGTSGATPTPAPPPAPPSPPPSSATLSAGVTRAEMVTYLNAHGYSAKQLEDASIQTSIDGIIFDVYFFNCHGERCADLELSAGWKMQSLPSSDLLNQWNSTKRLARAFTNDKGDGLLVQMDLSLASASSMTEFEAYLKIWKTLLVDFKKQFQL
jgi:hypothetical protein